jgi:hypothetical protein
MNARSNKPIGEPIANRCHAYDVRKLRKKHPLEISSAPAIGKAEDHLPRLSRQAPDRRPRQRVINKPAAAVDHPTHKEADTTPPSLPHSISPSLPPLPRSPAPSLHHSITPPLHFSIPLPLPHSISPSLHHSITPPLRLSITPFLHPSITPPLHPSCRSASPLSIFYSFFATTKMMSPRFR